MKKKLYIGPATYEGETKDDIPHGYVYIKFIYEDKKEIQGDVDPLTINFPMIKNND